VQRVNATSGNPAGASRFHQDRRPNPTRADTGNVKAPGWAADGVGARRRTYGFLLAVVVVPLVTAALSLTRENVVLTNDLLVYLLAALAVTWVGGLWPALATAVASVLCLNYYFTPPIHTWTIESGQNIAALLLFVTIATTFSAVVHVAAREAAASRRAAAEAGDLADLAQTVLADDSADAVLAHLATTRGLQAVLEEESNGQWRTVAGTPPHDNTGDVAVLTPRPGLRLRAAPGGRASRSMLTGAAAQAAAALDRTRLRDQAAHAEALAQVDQMQTALLAGVSHDLRTPLAAVKAGVSSLRQTDVEWSPTDHDELVLTIEEGTDRLVRIVDNLLDMTRLQTGTVSPSTRPTSVDEVLPAALDGFDRDRIRIDVPDDLPLVDADPGLLERVLANVIGNALAFSGDKTVEIQGSVADDVAITVVDHGPGVDEGDRDAMFQPFQQVGDRRTGGLGLGLAVASGFIHAMRGALTVESTDGGGLTMTVRLPVADKTAR
jgi:two-component system sensor histidine kinase KdpD